MGVHGNHKGHVWPSPGMVIGEHVVRPAADGTRLLPMPITPGLLKNVWRPITFVLVVWMIMKLNMKENRMQISH